MGEFPDASVQMFLFCFVLISMTSQSTNFSVYLNEFVDSKPNPSKICYIKPCYLPLCNSGQFLAVSPHAGMERMPRPFSHNHTNIQRLTQHTLTHTHI